MKKTIQLILVLLFCLFIANCIMGLMSNYIFPDSASNSLITFILYSGSFILTIVGLSIFSRSFNWHRPSPRPRIEKLNLPLLLLAIILIMAIDVVMEPVISLMPESNLDAMYDMMDGGLWSIFTAVIAAPILEEFIFRGYLQKNLVDFLNPYVGIVLASLIFGAIHLIPQQVILASLIAMVIGVIYYLTNSLMTAIAIHILNNGLSYTLTMFFEREAKISEILRLSPQTHTVVYYCCLGLLLVMLYVAIVRISNRIKLHRVDEGVAEGTK